MAKETAAEATIDKIEKKVQKGEDLTPEEKKTIMSIPVEGEDDDPESGEEEAEEEEDPGKKPAPEKKPEAKEKEPEGKKPDAADPGKAKEKEPEKKPESKAPTDPKDNPEFLKKVEKELEKPEGEEDLHGYTPRERAIFFEMKRERRKRQDAQLERDILRRDQIKEKKEREEREKAAEEAAKAGLNADEIEKLFEGRDDDDIPTIGEIKKLLSKRKEAPKKEAVDTRSLQYVRSLELRVMSQDARDQVNSSEEYKYEEVIGFAEEVLAGDQDSEIEIAECFKQGGNVALKTYNLILASKKWPEVEAKIKAKRGEKDAKSQEKKDREDRAARLEENKDKIRVTGSGGGGAGGDGELTLSELLELEDAEYAKVPANVRDKLLKTY